MSRRVATKGWTFAARFRARAFGWRSSRLACQRLKAVSEIKAAARVDPVHGAAGVVLLFERLWPALEQVDSSSGALGTAVHHAVIELTQVLLTASTDDETLDGWLERLWEAIQDDGVEFLYELGERWGDVCRSPERAGRWADRILPALRLAATAKAAGRYAYVKGQTACLSALVAAGRHDELREIVECSPRPWWPERRFVVAALMAEGRKREALEYAEASRDGLLSYDHAVDAACEEILLSSGLGEEAYRRYAFRANGKTTRVATLRAIAAKYPSKAPETILRDLVAASPGEEGKWFAAAKDLGLHDLAIELASRSPADPKTLNRAARDHVTTKPAFAVEAALLSVRWISEGYGYELTAADVLDAVDFAFKAGEALGAAAQVRERIQRIVPANAMRDPFLWSTILRRLDR